MSKYGGLVVPLLLSFSTALAAADGLIAVKSLYSAQDTMNRLEGIVKLGYNDPGHLVGRHGAAQCPAAENVRKGLAGIAEAATAR